MSKHFAVVDLGYGDAGKGTIVDWLCANESVRAVIRFNGGAQAGHNVVTPEGRHHTFSQFGSGTFQGIPTYLSRFVVVDPLALSAEAAALDDPYELLTVDPDALLATPWHRAANRKRETLRGQDRHGSCGLGVGEAMAFSLVPGSEPPRVADALAPRRLRARLRALRDHLTDELGPDGLSSQSIDDFVDVMLDFASLVTISDRLPLREPCVFEGAQGVLLDEWRGFHPYTTWSTTTFDNVLELTTDIVRLGVVRTYATRHGPGPFVTEDESLSLAEPHNDNGPWQGAFRAGHFDAVAHRYAIEVCGGVDCLAVTHCDVAVPAYCDSYTTMDRIDPGPFKDLDYQERLTRKLFASRPVLTPGSPPIGQLLGAQVFVESHGPRTNEKKRP